MENFHLRKSSSYYKGWLYMREKPCLVPRPLFVFRLGQSVSDHVVYSKKTRLSPAGRLEYVNTVFKKLLRRRQPQRDKTIGFNEKNKGTARAF